MYDVNVGHEPPASQQDEPVPKEPVSIASDSPASDSIATSPANDSLPPDSLATDGKPLGESTELATRLIEEFQSGVWRYLRALGCDAALAEDLTQETFIAVMQRPFADHGRVATGAYLRRVAHNLYVTFRRRHGRVVTTGEVEEISQAWERWAGQDQGEELVELLNDCLSRLTDRARRALEMRFRGEHTRNEIAEFLAITEHGAKNLMQRAKHQLRECIEQKLKRS